MSRTLLQESLGNIYPDLYSFSFSLIPEVLQAEQICLDSIDILSVKNKPLLYDFLYSPSKQVQTQIKLNCLKNAWSLGTKRFQQIKDGIAIDKTLENKVFFTLDITHRGLLFLKTRLKLSSYDIELITGYDRYKILSFLTFSRSQLLKQKYGKKISHDIYISSNGERLKNTEQLDLLEFKKNDHCSLSAKALSLLNDDMRLVERKKYLLHTEGCPLCAQYITSLRKDLSNIDKLIPSLKVPGIDSGRESYFSKVTSLVDNLDKNPSSLQQKAEQPQKIGNVYKFFKNKFKKIVQFWLNTPINHISYLMRV